MSRTTLSTPQVTVNNNTVAIVPNSLTYDGGEGQINVRAASSGGAGVESVHSGDAETRIGKVMFDIYLKDETDGFISTWKSQLNVISFGQASAGGVSTTRTFRNMSLVNDVERNAAADGVVSLEFEGDPMTL